MVKKILMRAINVVSILVIAAALVVLLTAVMTKSGDVPSLMGYSVFRIMTGSMAPAIPTNSVIVTRAVAPADIEVGDIISYFSKDPTLNGAVNTHRVVDIYEESGTVFYQTRGDANNADDLYPPTADQIIGKVIFTSHILGVFLRLISNPLIFFPLILAPLLILVILNLVHTVRMAAAIARQEEAEAIRKAIEGARKKARDADDGETEDAPDPPDPPDLP